MTLYPSAAQVARDLPIADGDDIAALADRWTCAHARDAGRSPEPAMVAAARRVLEQRLECASPPPLPSSAAVLRRP